MSSFEEEVKKGYEKNIQSCLVIHRHEMPLSQSKKTFREVDITSITSSIMPIMTTPFVMFIDKDGSTKLLKNRYGRDGVIISNNQYEHYLELVRKETEENMQALRNDINKTKNENNKFNSGAQKKSFLGRVFSRSIWPFHCS